ncbi:hypothetical protein BJ684DRAFT_7526 [Piptocephalis cylindrospora]|uniref:PHD-type domain-containing protein n=1 Tax=Piptocephalis cylindrospora TaxID=1907219 RepID=A0A4P9Y7P1_9FUNG|nr:hypothetical protein BJ684DRAFT_7526 [Piptocephalis cylindrospora]|eukprot:RKP15108.1 hypothetical protein BJ684DRAFT_7526 [Piptocephalis cylindrospora]
MSTKRARTTTKTIAAEPLRCPACPVASDISARKGNGPTDVWMQCDGCDEWYHCDCINVPAQEVDTYDRWHCPDCLPSRGPSTCTYSIL